MHTKGGMDTILCYRWSKIRIRDISRAFDGRAFLDAVGRCSSWRTCFGRAPGFAAQATTHSIWLWMLTIRPEQV